MLPLAPYFSFGCFSHVLFTSHLIAHCTVSLFYYSNTKIIYSSIIWIICAKQVHLLNNNLYHTHAVLICHQRVSEELERKREREFDKLVLKQDAPGAAHKQPEVCFSAAFAFFLSPCADLFHRKMNNKFLSKQVVFRLTFNPLNGVHDTERHSHWCCNPSLYSVVVCDALSATVSTLHIRCTFYSTRYDILDKRVLNVISKL